jgi:hypothetical protein
MTEKGPVVTQSGIYLQGLRSRVEKWTWDVSIGKHECYPIGHDARRNPRRSSCELTSTWVRKMQWTLPGSRHGNCISSGLTPVCDIFHVLDPFPPSPLTLSSLGVFHLLRCVSYLNSNSVYLSNLCIYLPVYTALLFFVGPWPLFQSPIPIHSR